MTNRPTAGFHQIILIILGLGLIFGLTPMLDMDQDGVLDSILVEINLMMSFLFGLGLPVILIALQNNACVSPRPAEPIVLVPPPIHQKSIRNLFPDLYLAA